LVLLPWLVLAYLATGFYSVRPSEQAVVRRWGGALGRLRSPGLHFGFPYGIDRVSRVRVLESKRVGVGTTLAERVLGRRAEPQRAECLTGDRNLILVSAIVQYQIKDPKAYLFNVADVPVLVRNAAASALSSLIAGMNVDDILTVQRDAVQVRALRATQTALDRYRAGVQVTVVSLEGVAPPQEVADAFRDVTSARGDKQRAINEARGYANRLIPRARGEAHRILAEAEAYREEIVRRAEGEAERFVRVAAELSNNRQLTVRRLILETMEEVLPRLNKVILDGHAVDLGLFEAKE